MDKRHCFAASFCQTIANMIVGSLLLLILAMSLVATTASAGNFTVIDGEIWDGINNPHAADGVTLSLLSTTATYTIPFQMTIGSGATLQLRDPFTFVAGTPAEKAQDRAITFNFSGASNAGLVFTDSNSVIDVWKGIRTLTSRNFTLNMNNNPISGLAEGAGKILSFNYVGGPNTDGSSTSNIRDSYSVVINTLNNITMGTIDTSYFDTLARNTVINATGATSFVDVDNLYCVDSAYGGGPGGAITVNATGMKLGNMATYSLRPSSAVGQGTITLNALAQPMNSTDNLAGNTVAANTVTLEGLVNQDKVTQTTDYDDPGGTVTINAAKVTLASAFAYNPNRKMDGTQVGTFTINTGREQPGFNKPQMFVNNSGVVFTEGAGNNRVNYTTLHDGAVPEPRTLLFCLCGIVQVALFRYRRTFAVR